MTFFFELPAMMKRKTQRLKPFLPLSPIPLATSLRSSSCSSLLPMYQSRCRNFASSSASKPPFTKEETNSLFQKLSQLGPAFEIEAKDVRLLEKPATFHEELKSGIRSAKHRISLAALYLGTGDQEKELLTELDDACARNESLEVSILLDCVRGSRGTTNSITVLQPLLDKYRGRATLYLYHTPALRGLVKTLAPDRWNEVLGVMHLKSFVFDDRLLLSGANLSDSYFTNRQDRYAWVKSKSVSNFFYDLVNTVGRLSYQIDSNGELQLPTEGLDPLQNPREYKQCMRERLAAMIKPMEKHYLSSSSSSFSPSSSRNRTWIFPTIQMGPVSVGHDEAVTSLILSHPRKGTLDLSSAYFNITESYAEAILNTDASHRINIITASPQANGFLNGKGMSGYIPEWYSCMERIFYDHIRRLKQEDRIKIWEYIGKDGWTYHAKGLWYSPEGNDKPLPILTMLGSPNFGRRSVERDLEAQIVLLTEDPQLREHLAHERDRLFASAEEVASRDIFDRPERKIHSWVPWLIKPLASYF